MAPIVSSFGGLSKRGFMPGNIKVSPTGVLSTYTSDISFVLSIAMDTNNNLYVADNFGAEISKFDTSLNKTSVGSGYGVISGLTFADNNTDLFIQDQSDLVYGETAWSLLNVSNSYTNLYDHFYINHQSYGLFYKNGIFYTANPDIGEIIQSNNFPSNWYTYSYSPNLEVFNVNALTMDNNDNLYVSNTSGKVFKYNGSWSVFAGGGVNTTLPRPATQLSFGIAPYGMAADSANNIYISDYDQNRIIKVDPSGYATLLVSGIPEPSFMILNKNEVALYVVGNSYGTIYKIT